MNERNLVICDTELGYAQGLGENVLNHKEFSVKVYICSDLEHVLELAKEKQIHLFVVDEKYAYEERCTVGAKQIFVLCKGMVSDLGDKECAVRKYQCADGIIREIFAIYTERSKEELHYITTIKEAKIIAIYSPIHRIGKTTFAMELAKEYAKTKKTIYINMEEYAGFDGSEQQGRNLGDLLYYVKQGNPNMAVRMEEMVVQKGDLDYLLPIPIALDLKQVTEEEWKGLFDEFRHNSSYERIVLDIGESIQGLFQILKLCNRIYMPILKDEISMRKIKKYETNLERLHLQEVYSKTYTFVMPDNVCEYAKIRAKEEV